MQADMQADMRLSDKLKEARRLQERGLYANASDLFQEALAESPRDKSTSARLEFVSMQLTQGLLGECNDHLMQLCDSIDRRLEEPQIVAVVDLLHAILAAASTVKMERPLRSSVEIYNKQLVG
ncbi:hypothetical protein CDD81_4687 [Ophiocordyceps australis]|uniref:Uncharacterized protein n=1 Tax=Ophiocordyceps australis TaxID=1399860 RepID=A0A2C5YA41_9HYPO|nr:hypothetical protein CDD81_4687 [Ophiocordyceps australis]